MSAPFRKCRVRTMSPATTAWVAGILEGEGSFFIIKTKPHVKARIQCQMTDRDVLERLAEEIGSGNVCVVTHRPGRKQAYQWTVSSRADVIELARQVFPWLGMRRRDQVNSIVAALNTEGW